MNNARGDFEPVSTYADTRRELRTPSKGYLSIEVGANEEIVSGFLLDASPHGFCIAHQHPGFLAGQEVCIVYPWGKVPAWVVWVKTGEGEIKTGFRTD